MLNVIPYRRHNSAAIYDPMRMMDEMERRFFGEDTVPAFRTDIRDCGNAYTLEAELPGMEKEDIHLQLNNDCLTISAEHKTESESKDARGNYICRERSFGSCSRSFDVSEIDTSAIKASYRNGVLTLTLPKKRAVQPESRTLEIE